MGSSNTSIEYLPMDGSAIYFGIIWTQEDANALLEELLANIMWKNDEAIIFGKHIITKRKVAWYGDQAYDYTYSNTTKRALPWTAALMTIKKKVEKITGETYNSCLLNLYHDGAEGMAWHSDSESALKKHGAIASVSFGAQRKFCFKHKESKERIDLQLEHGSLLLMSGVTQHHWLHRLPPTKKVLTPRVNLTFRTII